MELLRVKLSLPVSVNRMYTSGKNGRWYMTEEARAWKDYAIYSIRDDRACKDRAAIQAARDYKAPLVLYLDVNMPAEQILSRDSDNMVKLTQDAVTTALWPSDSSYDDRFVFDVHVTKRPTTTKETAFILVALSTLEDQELRHAIQPTAPRRTPPTRRRAAHRALAQPGTRATEKRARAGDRTDAQTKDTHRAS